MVSEHPTPSWCLVCYKRYDPRYTSGHDHDIPTILCLPENLSRFPYDHKREGHNGVYLRKPEPSDVFRKRNINFSLYLTKSSFEGDGLKFPPIQYPERFEEFHPAKSSAILEVLEPVPQVTSQSLKFILNR